MEKNKTESVELDVMFHELEEVIESLGSSEVSLEQSFSLYNKGMETIRKCNGTIEEIEKKVQVIDQNGEYHEF
ncbi:MAG: exodeoxyribonuclease VII small subunit [Eubacteriales bacterium]